MKAPGCFEISVGYKDGKKQMANVQKRGLGNIWLPLVNALTYGSEGDVQGVANGRGKAFKDIQVRIPIVICTADQ